MVVTSVGAGGGAGLVTTAPSIHRWLPSPVSPRLATCRCICLPTPLHTRQGRIFYRRIKEKERFDHIKKLLNCISIFGAIAIGHSILGKDVYDIPGIEKISAPADTPHHSRAAAQLSAAAAACVKLLSCSVPTRNRPRHHTPLHRIPQPQLLTNTNKDPDLDTTSRVGGNCQVVQCLWLWNGLFTVIWVWVVGVKIRTEVELFGAPVVKLLGAAVPWPGLCR